MKQAIINQKGDTVELLLYDIIGSDFFGEGISAKTFREQIKGIKASTINVRINSPGGSVFEAAAMVNALDQHKARIEVDVDGLAASAASVVAMAGDEIRVASNGMVMIHNPHALVMGGSEDMRKMAELLDKSRGQLVDSYMRRPGLDRAWVENAMDQESWFTGQEAVDVGLADSVSGPVQVAACAGLDKFKYRHAPTKLPEPAKVDLSSYRKRLAACLGA